MEGAKEKGAPPLGAYTSKVRAVGEGLVGGGGGQGQAETKSVSAAGAHASSGTRGAGGGRAEQLLGGQGGTAGPLPQCAEAENAAQKAANQTAAGNHGVGAGAGNNHEVVRTLGDGPPGGVHEMPLRPRARNVRALHAV